MTVPNLVGQRKIMHYGPRLGVEDSGVILCVVERGRGVNRNERGNRNEGALMQQAQLAGIGHSCASFFVVNIAATPIFGQAFIEPKRKTSGIHAENSMPPFVVT